MIRSFLLSTLLAITAVTGVSITASEQVPSPQANDVTTLMIDAAMFTSRCLFDTAVTGIPTARFTAAKLPSEPRGNSAAKGMKCGSNGNLFDDNPLRTGR